MNLELLPFSFSAGVATFFSPCFVAMLPAYILVYLGQPDLRANTWWKRGGQGLAVGIMASAGFLTCFAGLGVLFGFIGSAIARYLPWLAVLSAILIVITGIWMLVHRTFSLSLSGLASRWFRLRTGQGLRSFYLYGIMYAICSASCSLPIFLAVMMQTFISGGIARSLLNFLAYGWGMSAMMVLLSVIMAYSKGAVYKLLSPVSYGVQRASGVFMIVAGGYVLYYLLIYGRYLEDLSGR